MSEALLTARPGRAWVRTTASAAVSAVALIVMIGVCASLQPDVLSVTGLSLVLSSTVPLVIAEVCFEDNRKLGIPKSSF